MQGQVVEVAVEGSLCGHEALALAGKLSGSQLTQASQVVLTLRRVSGADAAGLALLLRLYSQLSTRNIRLTLEEVPEAVRRMLSEVGLTHLLCAVSPSRAGGTPSAALRLATAAGA